jgi:hypothetical protein
MNHFRNALKSSAPYYDPEGQVLDLKDAEGLCLKHVLTNIFGTGATGSGKSSGPFLMLLKALLRSTAALPGGIAAIFFFAKNGEAEAVEQLCRRLGRGEDVIRITPGGRYGFNFMQWIAGFGEGGERGPLAIVALLEEIASILNPQAGGNSRDPFWETAMRTRLTNLVLLAQLARLPVTLDLLAALLASAPVTLAQAQDAKWQKGSVMWHCLREAEAWTQHDPAARRDWEAVRRYHLESYAQLDNKPKSSIETMVEQLINPFLVRPLRPLLAEQTTFTPEMLFDGKLVLVDVPTQEYGLTGRMLAIALKRCVQLAIMRRSGPPGSLRPVGIIADEAQNFISQKDTEFAAVSRSAGGFSCYFTQQISSVREALGSPDKAENLTSNLAVHFACANAGETARWNSQRIGEQYTQKDSINVGRSASVMAGIMGDAGTSGGVSRAEQKRSYIEPAAFQFLRRGGEANGFMVDAVVSVGGMTFAGTRKGERVPFKIVSFDQKG